MRWILAVLLLLFALVFALAPDHTASAAPVLTAGWYPHSEDAYFTRSGTWSLQSSSAWIGATSFMTVDATASWGFAYYGRGATLYADCNTAWDDTLVCLDGVCRLWETGGSNERPCSYDLEVCIYPMNPLCMPPDLGYHSVEIYKATANAVRIYIDAVYIHEIPPDQLPPIEITVEASIGAEETAEPITVFAEYSDPDDPEATPQVVAYRYETTAGDQTTHNLLFVMVVAQLVMVFFLIFLFFRSRLVE